MASKDSGKNPKLVRDSFTIPKNEFATIDVLKTRAIAMGTSIKKSELLRAGLMVLKGLNDAAFKSALAAVPTLKTGRPVTEKPAQKSSKVALKPKAPAVPAAPKAVKPAPKASPVKAAAPKPTPKPAEKAAPARSAQKTQATAASRARAAGAQPAVKAAKPAPKAKAPAAPAPAKTAEAAR